MPRVARRIEDDARVRLGGESARSYTIRCLKCGAVEPMAAYAIAQLSMGNDLKFTCIMCYRDRKLSAKRWKTHDFS